MNNEIRLAKRSYYHNSLNEYKVNSRKICQTINELTSRKSGKESVTSVKVNGVSTTKFKNHFATIGSKLASKISIVITI